MTLVCLELWNMLHSPPMLLESLFPILVTFCKLHISLSILARSHEGSSFLLHSLLAENGSWNTTKFTETWDLSTRYYFHFIPDRGSVYTRKRYEAHRIGRFSCKRGRAWQTPYQYLLMFPYFSNLWFPRYSLPMLEIAGSQNGVKGELGITRNVSMIEAKQFQSL